MKASTIASDEFGKAILALCDSYDRDIRAETVAAEKETNHALYTRLKNDHYRRFEELKEKMDTLVVQESNYRTIPQPKKDLAILYARSKVACARDEQSRLEWMSVFHGLCPEDRHAIEQNSRSGSPTRHNEGILDGGTTDAFGGDTTSTITTMKKMMSMKLLLVKNRMKEQVENTSKHIAEMMDSIAGLMDNVDERWIAAGGLGGQKGERVPKTCKEVNHLLRFVEMTVEEHERSAESTSRLMEDIMNEYVANHVGLTYDEFDALDEITQLAVLAKHKTQLDDAQEEAVIDGLFDGRVTRNGKKALTEYFQRHTITLVENHDTFSDEQEDEHRGHQHAAGALLVVQEE